MFFNRKYFDYYVSVVYHSVKMGSSGLYFDCGTKVPGTNLIMTVTINKDMKGPGLEGRGK